MVSYLDEWPLVNFNAQRGIFKDGSYENYELSEPVGLALEKQILPLPEIQIRRQTPVLKQCSARSTSGSTAR
jgi:hypothetical protein